LGAHTSTTKSTYQSLLPAALLPYSVIDVMILLFEHLMSQEIPAFHRTNRAKTQYLVNRTLTSQTTELNRSFSPNKNTVQNYRHTSPNAKNIVSVEKFLCKGHPKEQNNSKFRVYGVSNTNAFLSE
jgi:hypothetical protein